jgi:ParB-like nuclease family protein
VPYSSVNKIVHVPLERLKPWPGNPRRGDIEAIKQSLLEHGQYAPLHAQMTSEQVFVGNNRLTAMSELGWTHADVVYHDIDDEKATRINLADNRTSDLGVYDDEALAAMLAELDGNYQGTGWTPEEADRILAALIELTELDGDFREDSDSVVVLEDVPSTGAAYAELPQEEAARAERQAAQTPSAVKGTREIVLVYREEDHREVLDLLVRLRKAQPDKSFPALVLELLRTAAQELSET